MANLPNVKMTSRMRKNFVRKAEQQGFEVFEYSGRGMFGEYCPAIKVDYLCEFEGHENYYTDSLGLGAVIYAR